MSRRANGTIGEYITLLRGNSNYRALWYGEVVSLFGDWFNLIASAALVSYLTQSGLALSSLFVVRMLAPFIVSPFAGVAADRYNRKTLLILADLFRGIVVLGFLLVREPQHVWFLYVLTAVQLAFSGVFFPARNAILPDIVTRKELGAANALSSSTWSVMLSIGAALGGLVAGGWGIYPAFVIDSLTFFLSAFFISRIAYQPRVALDSDRSVGQAIRQYVEGLRYLKQRLDILAISTQKAVFSLMQGGAFQVVQVILAERYFRIGEGGGTSLGLLYALAGVGTGLGPIAARVFTRDDDRRLRQAIGWGYLISVAGLALVAPLWSFPVVLFGTFLRSFGGGINWVFSTQLLLQLLPDNVRGRIFSTEFAMFTLATAVSTQIGGYLVDVTRVSIPTLMWGMAGLMLFSGLVWVLWVQFGPKAAPLPEEGTEALGETS